MTKRKYTNRNYLDALEKKVLVFDGAMGTSLQVQNLTAEHFGGEQYNGCNDYLVISYPEPVEQLRPITSIPMPSRMARAALTSVPSSMRPVVSSVTCAWIGR